MESEEKLNVKKYQMEIEKKLDAFKYAREWSDFVSLLSGVDATIKTYECDFVPKTKMLCKRLVQCLNPALPAGVHSRALQTYALVFSKFSKAKLAENFQIVTFGFFSSASNIKTFSYELYLDIIKKYILPLKKGLSKYAINVLIGLLPFLEAENSEFFSKAASILEEIKYEISGSIFYFSMWQRFYADPNARRPVINYMLKCSPRDKKCFQGSEDLALQSIAAGLGDKNIMVLRGTLDILLQTETLYSLGSKRESMLKVVLASLKLLLIRDSSLNKRVHSLLSVLGETREETYHIVTKALCILLAGDESDVILFYQIMRALIDKADMLHFLIERVGAASILKTLLSEKGRQRSTRASETSGALECGKIGFLKNFREFHSAIDQDFLLRVILSKFIKYVKLNQVNRECDFKSGDTKSPTSSQTMQNEEAVTDSAGVDFCILQEKSSTNGRVYGAYSDENNSCARARKDQNRSTCQNVLVYGDLVNRLHNPDMFLDAISYFLKNVDIIDEKVKKVHISGLMLILTKYHKSFNLEKLLEVFREHSEMLGTYEGKFQDITQELEDYYLGKTNRAYHAENLHLLGANICRYIETLVLVPRFGVFCQILEVASQNYGFFECVSDDFWSVFYNNILERRHSEKLRALPILERLGTKNMNHKILFEHLFSRVTPKSVECLFRFNIVFKGKLEEALLWKIACLENNEELLEKFIRLFSILVDKHESREFCLLHVLIYLNNKVMECGAASRLFSKFIGFFPQIHNVAYVGKFFVRTINTSNIEAVASFEMQNQGILAKTGGKDLPLRFYVGYPQIEVIKGGLMLLENFLKYSYHFCRYFSLCHNVDSSIKRDILDTLLFLIMTELEDNPFNISSKCVQVRSLEVLHHMIEKGILKSADVFSYDLTYLMKHLVSKKDQCFIANSTSIVELGLRESNVIVCSFAVDYFRRGLSAAQSRMVEIVLDMEDRSLQFKIFKDIMNSVSQYSHVVLLHIIVNHVLNNALHYTSEDIAFIVGKAIELLYEFHTPKYETTSALKYKMHKVHVGARARCSSLLVFTEKVLATLYRGQNALFIDRILRYQPHPLFNESYPVRNRIYESVLEKVLSKDVRALPYLRKMNTLYKAKELTSMFSEATGVLTSIFITNKNKCDVDHYTYLLDTYAKLYPMNKHREFVIRTYENLVFFLQKLVINRITQALDDASPPVQLYKLFTSGFGAFVESVKSHGTFQALFYMFYQILTHKANTVIYIPTLVFFNDLAVHSAYSKYWTRELYGVLFMPGFFNETKGVMRLKFELTKKLVKLDAERFGEVFYKLDQGFFLSREAEVQNRAQTLKRLAFLIFCGDMDQFASFVPKMLEKINEFLVQDDAVRRDVFLVVRIMILRIRHPKLTNLWPMLFNEIFRVFENAIESGNLGLVYEVLKTLDLIFVLNTPETMEYHAAFFTKRYTSNGNIGVRYRSSQTIIEPYYCACSEGVGLVSSICKSCRADDSYSSLQEGSETLSYFERLSSCLRSQYKHVHLNVPDKRRLLLNIIAGGISNLQLKEYLDCAPIYYLHLDVHASVPDSDSITMAILDDFWG